MLVEKPTGITNYIHNILPYFSTLEYHSLLAKKFSNNNYKNPYFISEKLSPDNGSKGHFLRLKWTQFELGNIFRNLKANLLFSPVPEMPLFTKTKAVVMVHDLIPIRFPKKKSPLTPYFRYYIPQVCRQAQHIICNSQATANDIINYFGISATKITPIYLGYNQKNFRVIEGLKDHQKTPYFLYLGRHDPHKNVSKIISAFAQFKHSKNYQLWLCGPFDTRYTPLLKQQAQELGIATKVIFLDYVSSDDLPVIINQAQALVFPTLWEGFGFPVLEAIACGTPVITSNVSSLPEVVGEAGILVNPYEIKSISEGMNLMADDNDLRKKLGELGLKRARNFSWEKTGKETVKVIEQFL
ncbi:glycosyltransferase family 1 protein [Geminocystis sp. GBBB08]|uniref:glycosyltransferase family 4 protein n=1 Tax=Geminocystis sp. GBBB08 TaxID=2604140 RepID=UPI0027E33FCB|nr:glycosyltransferase family 1 protein [Geminocystis sp. GBBB08]MBL1211551.1 glycosyltransferase family 4 protein [Geminocystis sp. GBBB08]